MRNRGPEEHLSFPEVRRAESELFSSHPELHNTDLPLLLGVPALIQRLLELQEQIMRTSLPQVLAQVCG